MNNLPNLSKTAEHSAIKTFEIDVHGLPSFSKAQDAGIEYNKITGTFNLNMQEIVSKKSYLECAQAQWNKNMPYILALACKSKEDNFPTVPMAGLEAFHKPKFLPVQACAEKIYYFVLKNIAAPHLKNLGTSQQLKHSNELQLFFQANSGEAEAQYLLAQNYLEKNSLKNSYNKAFNYFSLAAEQGHAKAAFEAAQLILKKNIVKDIAHAFDLLKQAIKAGHIEALSIYLENCFLSRDTTITSFSWIIDWVKNLPDSDAHKVIKIILDYPDLFAKDDIYYLQLKLKQEQMERDYRQGMELLDIDATIPAWECFDRAGQEGHIPSLIQQGMLYSENRINNHSKKDAAVFFQRAYDLLSSLPEQDRSSIRKTFVKQLIDSYVAQGGYCFEQKEWDGALTAFNMAEKYGMQKSKVRSLILPVYIAQGKEYLAQCQWDKAITAFNAASKCSGGIVEQQEIEALKLPTYYERAKEKIKQHKASFIAPVKTKELQIEIASILDDLTKSRVPDANYLCGKIYAGFIPALNTVLDERKAKMAFDLAERGGHKGASLRLAIMDAEKDLKPSNSIDKLTALTAKEVSINEKHIRYQKKAALHLAAMYETGKKVTPSIEKAQSYYEQAARAEYKEEKQLHPGLAKAQFGLANFWLNFPAIDEEERLAQALPPLKQAKEQNFAPATAKLQEVETRIEEIQSELQEEIERQQQALVESQERKRKLDAMLLHSNKRVREQK